MHVKRRLRRDGTPCAVNLWHQYLMEAYWSEAWTWQQGCDATCIGYVSDEALYAESTPRPRLKDFMVRLSVEWQDRGAVA